MHLTEMPFTNFAGAAINRVRRLQTQPGALPSRAWDGATPENA